MDFRNNRVHLLHGRRGHSPADRDETCTIVNTERHKVTGYITIVLALLVYTVPEVDYVGV